MIIIYYLDAVSDVLSPDCVLDHLGELWILQRLNPATRGSDFYWFGEARYQDFLKASQGSNVQPGLRITDVNGGQAAGRTPHGLETSNL